MSIKVERLASGQKKSNIDDLYLVQHLDLSDQIE